MDIVKGEVLFTMEVRFYDMTITIKSSLGNYHCVMAAAKMCSISEVFCKDILALITPGIWVILVMPRCCASYTKFLRRLGCLVPLLCN